jgi:glycogen operon protein
MDYISCGFPDLSFHGTKAWYPDFSPYNRMLGVLLSGRYAKRNRREDDCFFYFIFNMHWEKHEFHLPKLPDGLQWYVLFETVNSLRATLNLSLEDQKQIEAVPRSVIGLIGK